MVSLVATSVIAAGAQTGIHEPGTGIENPERREAEQGTGQGLQQTLELGDYFNQAGDQMQVRAGEDNGITLRVRDSEAQSLMNITQERVQDRTKLMVHLSNGMNSEIKVMPNTASETALARLGAKCEDRNCTIELKEVGSGEQTRAAYEIKTQKQAKVLGLFQARMQVQAQVDAENGEVIQVKKPWWEFLATESE